MELREFAKTLNFKIISCGFVCSDACGYGGISITEPFSNGNNGRVQWTVMESPGNISAFGLEDMHDEAVVRALEAMESLGMNINDLNRTV